MASSLVPSLPYTKEEVKRTIRRNLHTLWRVQENHQRNPCSQPVSLERRHLPLLRNDDYVCADKTDGVRFVLFLTRVAGTELSFMMDRKMTTYQIPVAASRKYFDGSIFDGELVWTTNGDGVRSQAFLVFDVVCLKGDDDVRNFSLLKRLEIIRILFDIEAAEINSPRQAHALARQGKIICGGNSHGLSFKPKQCFPLDMMDTLVRKMDAMPYKTDGLIFTPINVGGCTGTQDGLYKLKTIHSVDIECYPAQLAAYLGMGGNFETARRRIPLDDVRAVLPSQWDLGGFLLAPGALASRPAEKRQAAGARDGKTGCFESETPQRHLPVRLDADFWKDLGAAVEREGLDAGRRAGAVPQHDRGALSGSPHPYGAPQPERAGDARETAAQGGGPSASPQQHQQGQQPLIVETTIEILRRPSPSSDERLQSTHAQVAEDPDGAAAPRRCVGATEREESQREGDVDMGADGGWTPEDAPDATQQDERPEEQPHAPADAHIKLTFFTLRLDKAHPNAQATLSRTLVNYMEAITVAEVLEHVKLRNPVCALRAAAVPPESADAAAREPAVPRLFENQQQRRHYAQVVGQTGADTHGGYSF
jgi:hypothetical protein